LGTTGPGYRNRRLRSVDLFGFLRIPVLQNRAGQEAVKATKASEAPWVFVEHGRADACGKVELTLTIKDGGGRGCWKPIFQATARDRSFLLTL